MTYFVMHLKIPLIAQESYRGEQSLPKREDMWRANSKVIVIGLPKSAGAHITTPCAPCLTLICRIYLFI
jgi:hypothetical protein